MYFNRIIYIRESLELSQRQMANKLNVSKSAYAWWETGKHIIPLSYLVDMCNLSGYSLDFALKLSNNKSKIKKKITINYQKIGNKIKSIRLSNNLTQREFAKILNMSQSTIYRIENGHQKNLTSLLVEIAKQYKISIDWLCK